MKRRILSLSTNMTVAYFFSLQFKTVVLWNGNNMLCEGSQLFPHSTKSLAHILQERDFPLMFRGTPLAV